MKNIIDYKDELFQIYIEHYEENLMFSNTFCDIQKLRKDFERIIYLKTDYMPHWFVLELINGNYDIADNEEDFSIYNS